MKEYNREKCDMIKEGNLKNSKRKPKFELVLSALDKNQCVVKKTIKWIDKKDCKLSFDRLDSFLESCLEEIKSKK